MRRVLRTAIVMTVLMTVVTGLVYPLVMTGVASFIAPAKAHDSLLRHDGLVVGSQLIAQSFVGANGEPLPQYFQPRPSAVNYNDMSSGASNLGPSNSQLLASVRELVIAYRKFNDVPASVAIPSDAVTTSGSGLDPDISIANALLQAPRVARARGLPVATVEQQIRRATQQRWLGVIGEPVVNVLVLNLSLDSLASR
jgi:K+-transporting ATPase ATPase C chain